MTPAPETITKKELVNRIAEQTDLTKVVVKDVLQKFLDEIIDELAQGNRLEFREFGVFEVRVRAERVAQNPRTLEKVTVPSKRVVKFKVGRTMREKVCEEEPKPRSQPKAKAPEPSKPASKPAAPPPAPPPPKRPPPSNSPF
ncbi:MAG: integration host factor subunit beta [Planctomycetes bacterium]|nr:integration host factor subunit beta [Planctomycetota bacterium]